MEARGGWAVSYERGTPVNPTPQPQVARVGTPTEDAERRDLTINALFFGGI